MARRSYSLHWERADKSSNFDAHCHNLYHQTMNPVSESDTFARMVERSTGGVFTFDTITLNGTEANCYAITMASDMRCDKSMFPCGTYIAAHAGPLKNKSVVRWNPRNGQATLLSATDETHQSHREDVVALPYIINISERNSPFFRDEYDQYEKQCLDDLETRVILSRVTPNRAAFQILFIELLTIQHGATLSEEALRRIGQIAIKYSIKIVVDEIMTAGRIGPRMLAVLDAPREFLQQVHYVTIGIWTERQNGLVLARKTVLQHHNCDKRNHLAGFPLTEAIKQWQWAEQRLEFVPIIRHRLVHDVLQINSNTAWGKGLLLFTECFTNLEQNGICNRFLPLLYKKQHEKDPMKIYDYQKFQKKGTDEVKPVPHVCKEYQEIVLSWIGAVKKHRHKEDQIFENMCMDLIRHKFSLQPPYEYFSREYFVTLLIDKHCQPDDSQAKKNDLNKIAGRVVSNLIKTNFMTPTNPKRKRNGKPARLSTFNPNYPN